MNESLVQLMKTLPAPNNTISRFAIDVGAHYGEFSNFLVQSGFFDHVLSFEPNSQSYLEFLKNASSTDTCKLEVINSALSDNSGFLNLYCDADTATASLLKYDSNYLANGRVNTQSIPVTTLDEYFAQHKCGHLQLLKIDTQGNDLSVIKGGLLTIRNYRPIIQTEFIYIPLYEKQCTPAQLSDFLFSLNYEMYSLNNLHTTVEGRLAFCDAIFVPKEMDISYTQKYTCIDDQVSYKTQIDTLHQICAERLDLINSLDTALKSKNIMMGPIRSILKKMTSWVQ